MKSPQLFQQLIRFNNSHLLQRGRRRICFHKAPLFCSQISKSQSSLYAFKTFLSLPTNFFYKPVSIVTTPIFPKHTHYQNAIGFLTIFLTIQLTQFLKKTDCKINKLQMHEQVQLVHKTLFLTTINYYSSTLPTNLLQQLVILSKLMSVVALDMLLHLYLYPRCQSILNFA